MYTKNTIWISGVLFPSLNNIWRYMLGISNDKQWLKIAKDIAY